MDIILPGLLATLANYFTIVQAGDDNICAKLQKWSWCCPLRSQEAYNCSRDCSSWQCGVDIRNWFCLLICAQYLTLSFLPFENILLGGLENT